MRGELKKASDLFLKYQRVLVAPQASVIKEFVSVVQDLLSVQIPAEKVSYSPMTRTLSIKGMGPLKSEIKVREMEVLSHLRGRLGEKSYPKRLV